MQESNTTNCVRESTTTVYKRSTIPDCKRKRQLLAVRERTTTDSVNPQILAIKKRNVCLQGEVQLLVIKEDTTTNYKILLLQVEAAKDEQIQTLSNQISSLTAEKQQLNKVIDSKSATASQLKQQVLYLTVSSYEPSAR